MVATSSLAKECQRYVVLNPNILGTWEGIGNQWKAQLNEKKPSLTASVSSLTELVWAVLENHLSKAQVVSFLHTVKDVRVARSSTCTFIYSSLVASHYFSFSLSRQSVRTPWHLSPM